MMNQKSTAEHVTPALQVAQCTVCQGFSFPANVPGCRHCGSPELKAVTCDQPVQLLNVITVHAELAAGLTVPAIIGEVELCPGVIEEVRVDAENEAEVPPGTWLTPTWSDDLDGGAWVFRSVFVKDFTREVNAE
ncbi:hypothetical protein [Cupriavidus sp. D384]|uniref:hypothetical protein n=1 Tax=Cupriavidus sp. D384 TaxID=1538095 RepID=UPI0012E845B4|nr:hypothetical protein [Cupriavidus sp. D384]